MGQTLPPTADCSCTECTPCLPDVNVPGPRGLTGAAGTNGTNGTSAVTLLTADTVMPAELGSVTFSVVSNAGFSEGEYIYVQNIGFFEITGLTGTTQITATNLEDSTTGVYDVNVGFGTPIAIGLRVVPAGIQGPTGVSPLPDPTAGAGILYSTGVIWQVQTDPLPIVRGGTAGNSAATARTALGCAALGANNDITSLAALTTAITIAQGGTGATTAGGARTALGLGTMATQNANAVAITGGSMSGVTGVATSGANTNITSLGGLTTPLTLAQGGTGSIQGFAEALYRDEKASGTAGGAFNNGAWRTRDLTVESYDAGAIGALAANQVTLVAGTYIVEAEAPAYMVDNHQCRLQNITAGSTIAFGTTARADATDASVTISRLNYRFTVAIATIVELQHQAATTRAGDGFGVASTFGNVEVYSWVKFTKVA